MLPPAFPPPPVVCLDPAMLGEQLRSIANIVAALRMELGTLEMDLMGLGSAPTGRSLDPFLSRAERLWALRLVITSASQTLTGALRLLGVSEAAVPSGPVICRDPLRILNLLRTVAARFPMLEQANSAAQAEVERLRRLLAVPLPFGSVSPIPPVLVRLVLNVVQTLRQELASIDVLLRQALRLIAPDPGQLLDMRAPGGL